MCRLQNAPSLFQDIRAKAKRACVRADQPWDDGPGTEHQNMQTTEQACSVQWGCLCPLHERLLPRGCQGTLRRPGTHRPEVSALHSAVLTVQERPMRKSCALCCEVREADAPQGHILTWLADTKIKPYGTVLKCRGHACKSLRVDYAHDSLAFGSCRSAFAVRLGASSSLYTASKPHHADAGPSSVERVVQHGR
jgi:hypothetical protein